MTDASSKPAKPPAYIGGVCEYPSILKPHSVLSADTSAFLTVDTVACNTEATLFGEVMTVLSTFCSNPSDILVFTSATDAAVKSPA